MQKEPDINAVIMSAFTIVMLKLIMFMAFIFLLDYVGHWIGKQPTSFPHQ